MNFIKNKKVIIALAIPFLVMILFLVKIFHTVKSSQIPFEQRGGEIFRQDVFTQDFISKPPIEKAIYAVVMVRKNSDIMERIKKAHKAHREHKRYHWLAIGVKDQAQKNWIVTFRENNITPKIICQSQVVIKTGKVLPLECKTTKKNPIVR